MKNFFSAKVNRKVSAFCILLAIVVCIGTCISGYLQYRDSIYERYNNFAYEICDIARSYVNGDKIASYLETGKTDEEYDTMAQNIYNLYTHTTLYENKSGIYIFVPDCENYTCLNIFDVRIIEAEDKSIFEIGCVDPIGAEHPENVVGVYLNGERSDDYFIHETKFGYNSSAILPIFDSKGNPTALIVADMPIPYISETLNQYLITTILITALLVAAFMALFITVMKRTITTPLNVIAQEAKTFSQDTSKLSEVLPNMHQHDEIGLLAGSIYHMERDIQAHVENITAITAEKERIGAELNVATKIQADMLPSIFPAYPERRDFDICASMTPAKEVGGDFYDFFMLDDDHIALVIADVSGKGVPAALFMVVAKTLLKNQASFTRSPKAVLEAVNKQLCENNSAEMFVTAWMCIMEISTGNCVAANAGHEFPVIRKANGDFEFIHDRHGFVLAGFENSRYSEYEFNVEKYGTLFVYTDGVPEATNSKNELFGTGRMLNALNINSAASPAEIIENIKKEIDPFVGDAPQFDDITMLCIKRT